MREINSIIVHCSDSKTGSALEINSWHLERGWEGIGYHFVICNGTYAFRPDGIIEQGRHMSRVGAHAKGYNKDSIGICLIGEPELNNKCKYSLKQIQALKELCDDLMIAFGIPITNIFGHNELNNKKLCPGMDMTLLRDYIDKGTDETLIRLMSTMYL